MIYDATIPECDLDIDAIKVGHQTFDSRFRELDTPLEINYSIGGLRLLSSNQVMLIVDRAAAESLIRGLEKAIALEWV